jgi:hypothetical protein
MSEPVLCVCGEKPNAMRTLGGVDAIYYACPNPRCPMSAVTATTSWGNSFEEAAELWNAWVKRKAGE